MQNAFNEENRTAILWVFWYEGPIDVQITSNCYCHWATVVIRDSGSTRKLIHNKEGFTQGDPLAMIAYRIGVLPLI